MNTSSSGKKKKGGVLSFVRSLFFVEGYRKDMMDLPFLLIVVMLLLMGLVMVFSASHASAFYRFDDSYFFIRKQFSSALIGLCLMAVTTMVATPRLFKKMGVPLIGVALLLLIAVLLFGRVLNDAKRWIYIGSFNFQPSEIAKLAVVMGFSALMANNYKKMKTFKYGILPYATILGIYMFLLYLEPHFSAIIITIGISGAMMIAGGTNLKWLVGALGTAVGGVAILIFGTNYATSRIQIWLDPFVDPRGKGFQTIQSLYAIGSGGLFGLGLGKSRQKYLYIPEPQNDFIFSIAAEELGFIGATIIIVLFALLIWRGFVIALKAPDRFSALLVVGIISKVALQSILNIGVVTSLLPNTGISLPFFSYGGTSLVLQLIEMGIVLNISRYSRLVKV